MRFWLKYPVLLLFCFYLLSQLIGCTDSTPRLSKLPDDATILAFGDSLTFGSGASADQSYPVILQNLTGLKVVNAGKPGEVSKEGLKRLPDVLAETNPQLLILCHGGNDLLRKFDNNHTKQNLQQMVRLAQQQGISVILLAVPKPKLLLMKAAEFYPQIAKQFNIPVETDIIPAVVSDSSLKSDAIHPNAKGYEMVAQAVHKLLKRSGAL